MITRSRKEESKMVSSDPGGGEYLLDKGHGEVKVVTRSGRTVHKPKKLEQ